MVVVVVIVIVVVAVIVIATFFEWVPHTGMLNAMHALFHNLPSSPVKWILFSPISQKRTLKLGEVKLPT